LFVITKDMKKLLTILCLVLLVSLSTEISFSQSNQEDCDLLCQLGQSQSNQPQPKETLSSEENALNNTQWKIVFSDFEIGVHQTTLKSDGTFKYTVVETLGPDKGSSYDKPGSTWMFIGTQFGMSFNNGYLRMKGTRSKNDYMEGTYESVMGDEGTWYGELID